MTNVIIIKENLDDYIQSEYRDIVEKCTLINNVIPTYIEIESDGTMNEFFMSEENSNKDEYETWIRICKNFFSQMKIKIENIVMTIYTEWEAFIRHSGKK